MAVNDVYRLTLRQSLHGQVVLNVTHWRFKTVGATALILRTTVANALKEMMRPSQSNELAYVEHTSRGLIPLQEALVSIAGAPTAGGTASTSLPGMTAAIVSLRTGLPSKRRRGRLYVAGIPVADELDGTFAAVPRGTLQTAVDAFITTYGLGGTDADFEWGVWSRVEGLVLPPHNFAGYQAITSAIVRSNLGSFNTRKLGRGI